MTTEIEIGLTEEGREASAKALRKLIGETYALYVKTHGYHWNVTGPRFQSLHTMFMTQYTELWAALDEIAERIRALGYFAPGSSSEMMSEASLAADNTIPDAETMIINLVRGHEAVARAARHGIDIASEAGDEVTADLMTQRATISDKTAWMLRSSL
ncbi:MAG: Dps family protein [Pseudomonadota bacterium]